MAITLVQTTTLGATGNGTSQQTGTFAAQPTVGNYIVAWGWGWSNNAHGTPAFTDTGGNAYTVPSGAFQHIALDLWSLISYAKVATAGATFKVTLTSNMGINASVMVVAFEFGGVAATSPLDGTAGGTTGTTGVPAPGSKPLTSGSLVVAGMARNSTTFLGSTPTGFTRAAFQNDGTNFEVGEALYAINPASPTNPAWATSTTSWSASQFALLAAGAAPAFVARPPSVHGQAVPRAAYY